MTGEIGHKRKEVFGRSKRGRRVDVLVDMKILPTTATILLLCGLSSAALAGRGNPSGTGQPNQSCQVTMVTPGHAMSAGGSAFNPNGVSGAVYANPTSRGGIASGNSHVVAQYDVACYHQTQRVAKQSGSH
jgi:hypothetical protein